jgi:hypothetical protein
MRRKLIPEISEPVRQYLAGTLRAELLVNIIDDLVAKDFLHGLDPQVIALIERFHEALALYIRDEPTRKQEPGIYIGDDDLQRQAIDFQKALEQIELRATKNCE